MQPETLPLQPMAAAASAGVRPLNLAEAGDPPGRSGGRDAASPRDSESAPDSPSDSGSSPTPDSAPVRDARRISERIARDEVIADEARERYRSSGLPVLEPSSLVGLLDPDERLHAVHRLAMLERGWRGATGADPDLPHGGTLYVTSRQLLHRGAEDRSWMYADIEEMAVALERLLLIRLRDGSDLAIEVDQPRLLRVQLATALAASRAGEVADASEALGPAGA